MKLAAIQHTNWWSKYKFKLNGLVLILPFWFLYQSLEPQFPPALPKAQLGSYEVTLMPLDTNGPYLHHGEWVKDYYLQWCQGCAENIRQGFLLVSDTQPDLKALSAAESSLLHGNKHGLHVHARTPQELKAGDKLWLLIEDWQGQVFSHAWEL